MCRPASRRGENSSHSSRADHDHHRHRSHSCLSRRLRRSRHRGHRLRLRLHLSLRGLRPRHRERLRRRISSLLRLVSLLRVRRRAVFTPIGTAAASRNNNNNNTAATTVPSGVFLVASRGEGLSTRENSASTTPSTIEVSLVGRASTPGSTQHPEGLGTRKRDR